MSEPRQRRQLERPRVTSFAASDQRSGRLRVDSIKNVNEADTEGQLDLEERDRERRARTLRIARQRVEHLENEERRLEQQQRSFRFSAIGEQSAFAERSVSRINQLSQASEGRKSFNASPTTSTRDDPQEADIESVELGEDEIEDLKNARASAVVRRLGSALRGQFVGIKSSFRSGIIMLLVVAVFQGLLQLAWHWLFANVLAIHSGLDRAYSLVAPPMIWYVFMITLWTGLLCWVRNLPEDTLMEKIRQLFRLDEFEDIALRLQEGIDTYEDVSRQLLHAISSTGKVTAVGRRLAENLHTKRGDELSDAEKRERAVANVGDIVFELISQLRKDDPNPEANSPDAKKAALVREVSNLVRELKVWSEGDHRHLLTSPTAAPRAAPSPLTFVASPMPSPLACVIERPNSALVRPDGSPRDFVTAHGRRGTAPALISQSSMAAPDGSIAPSAAARGAAGARESRPLT